MKNRINFYWRVIGSGISFSVFGIGTLLLSCAFFLMIRLLPVGDQFKNRWILATIKAMCGFFIAMMRFFGLFSLQLNAMDRLPAGGSLIIANHPSLIDALFMAAHVDNLCCIVKAPLMSNPFTRYIIKLAGYIANQSDTLLVDASRALASGKNLLVFPEGTRTTDQKNLDFKRGAANIALYTNCSVTPVVFEISLGFLQKGQKWYQMPARPAQVAVSVCPALNPAEMVDTTRPITMQARELNGKLIELYQSHLTTVAASPELDLIDGELKESTS